MCQVQRYYHVSRKKLLLGETLRGGDGSGLVSSMVEEILERTRPVNCAHRSDCAFFSGSERASKHGLKYDHGYLHFVEPTGHIEKRDNYWIGQLQVRHTPSLVRWRSPELGILSDDEIGKKYWSGEPSQKPNWELVAPKSR
jgi:hypothetical protein